MMRDYLFLYNLGQMYVYYDSMWTVIEESMVGKIAWQYFPYKNFKHKLIAETVKLLRERATKKEIQWNSIGNSEIPLKGGILDLRTNEMRPHLPEDFLDRIIPYDYEPEAECPLWHKVLEDWLPGKDEEKRAIQQFFGYIMMPKASYKKALLLYGDTDTGKTQVCNIACKLVGGVRYTCGILPSQMGDPRARAPIKGMGLNIVPDLSKREVIDDGGFKQLVSSSEPVQLDKKFAQPETYIPTAKHMFAMNNLPAVTDATSAVFRRMLIIAFDAQIPIDKQDPGLEGKLMKEIEGIIAWGVRGAMELHGNNGIWPRISSSDLIVETYRRDQNPLFDFIEESGTVRVDPTGSITIEDLRTLFNEYHGTRPWTKKAVRDKVNALGYAECRKDLKRAVKGISKVGPNQLGIPSYLTPIDGGLSDPQKDNGTDDESDDKG
jgi:putative DNA primase/helicase